jgi:hypothetical protein
MGGAASVPTRTKFQQYTVEMVAAAVESKVVQAAILEKKIDGKNALQLTEADLSDLPPADREQLMKEIQLIMVSSEESNSSVGADPAANNTAETTANTAEGAIDAAGTAEGADSAQTSTEAPKTSSSSTPPEAVSKEQPSEDGFEEHPVAPEKEYTLLTEVRALILCSILLNSLSFVFIVPEKDWSQY